MKAGNVYSGMAHSPLQRLQPLGQVDLQRLLLSQIQKFQDYILEALRSLRVLLGCLMKPFLVKKGVALGCVDEVPLGGCLPEG